MFALQNETCPVLALMRQTKLPRADMSPGVTASYSDVPAAAHTGARVRATATAINAKPISSAYDVFIITSSDVGKLWEHGPCMDVFSESHVSIGFRRRASTAVITPASGTTGGASALRNAQPGRGIGKVRRRHTVVAPLREW